MQFTYRAKQGRQSEATGVIEATDLSNAVSHLRSMGLYPLEVVPLEKETPALAFPQGRPLSRAHLSLWARTVGQGLRAGLSLTQALHLLSEQEKGRPLGNVAKLLEEKVTAGMSLGDAMGDLGNLFSPVAINLVRTGEASGALEQVLEALAQQVEAESELIGKVRGALVYPSLVFTVGIGTVAVLLFVVVPKLGLLFAEIGQELPLATRFLISAGKGLVFAIAGIFLLLFIGFVASRGGRFHFSPLEWGMKIFGRLPVFKRLVAHADIARFSSTLALLLGQGLPLPESLRLVGETFPRSRLKNQVLHVEREVVEGMNLSAALRRAQIQEPFLLTMIAMGEAQGDLALAFRQSGDRYGQEVDRAIRVISTLIEPVMILLVGLIVGGIVISMLLPIFQLNFTVG